MILILYAGAQNGNLPRIQLIDLTWYPVSHNVVFRVWHVLILCLNVYRSWWIGKYQNLGLTSSLSLYLSWAIKSILNAIWNSSKSQDISLRKHYNHRRSQSTKLTVRLWILHILSKKKLLMPSPWVKSWITIDFPKRILVIF